MDETTSFEYISKRTSKILYLFKSQRSRQAISVTMYHPLNGHAVNWSPPQSNNILDTAGTLYHLKPSVSNHLYLKKSTLNCPFNS